MKRHNQDDAIVAISTPVGEGGIGIVRMSGANALKIADRIFAPKTGAKPSRCATYTVHYGHIIDRGPGTGDRGQRIVNTTPDPRLPTPEIIDEVLLTVMHAPKSYTREDIVEINCHGGIQAAKKVLDLALECGARIAEPGEFTKRAFLNGRIDLAQAEAVLDVIRAKTEGALRVAMDQLEGGLSGQINGVRNDIIEIATQIEASIDFPDEALETAQSSDLCKKTEGVLGKLKELLDTYSSGIIFREGVLAIICGKPNVGKSSLMNLLLKRDRVIVSPIPGTTRDAVEETINLQGIPVRLVDTAGITETRNILDKEGVRRSKRYLKLSDIAILMVDASVPLGKANRDIVRMVGGKKKIIVLNKIDIAKKGVIGKVRALFKNDRVIEISVKKRGNIKALEEAIRGVVSSGSFNQAESAMVSNARHKDALDKAYGCMLSVKKALGPALEFQPELVAVDLREAIFRLGLITGKSLSEDILDRIFEQFCIGK